MGTDNAADERGIDGSRRAFAADVANRNPEARQRIGNKVVEIAANGSRRNKLRLDVEMRHLRKRMRQQTKLEFARQREIAFQPPFLPRNLLIQARVFDGDRKLRRQCGQGSLVIFSEVTAAGMLQIEYSNYFLLVD